MSDTPHVLDAVHAFLGRFVAYPSTAAHVAHSLWVAHCHLMSRWETTPRLAFLSTEPASGKTRALEATEPLVPNAVQAVNVSPAYLFRKMGGDTAPTILYDEIDTVFGPKARDHEDIRGLLNAGYRRGAVAGRCAVQNKVVVTEEIPAYAAVAFAGLGNLPDTITSRSVIIRMRRRAPDERVEAWRSKYHRAEGLLLGERLAAWADTVRPRIGDRVPLMPDGIEDRNADIWEPLLAVADEIGGDWPERARVAAVTVVTAARQGGVSLGVRLLGDIQKVLGDAGAIFTTDLITGLLHLPESPWESLKGQPINARILAKLLAQYDVHPKLVRIGEDVQRGYQRTDFHDAFVRYLPTSPCAESVTAVTAHTGAGP